MVLSEWSLIYLYFGGQIVTLIGQSISCGGKFCVVNGYRLQTG